MAKRVAVLKGGMSSERDVSLVSGEACAAALRAEARSTAIGVRMGVFKVCSIYLARLIPIAALWPQP